MDETPKFDPYEPVRVSKLEALRSEIAEMSRQGWPLKKIREFLDKERGVKVSVSRLCVYCQSRNIKKGKGEVTAPAGPVAKEQASPKAEREPPRIAAVSERPSPDGEDLSGLLPKPEARSPFTKFKPKP